MITRNSLYTIPDVRLFASGAEADLAKALLDQERYTSVKHASAPAELCLDRDGRLPNGYAYTEAAFKQVCALAAKGLMSLVVDLAGLHRPAGSARGDYSFEDAIDLFNAVIRRRFAGRFAGEVRIVRDVHPGRKLVEGVLGPKYRYLENRTIYEMACEAVASAPSKVRFHEGAMAGRRLMIRFAHRKPLFELPTVGRGVEAFHGGYHFSNSEIAGEAPVRGATLLLRRGVAGGKPDPAISESVALGSFGSGRLTHTGKDFDKKLAKLFQAVLAAPQDPAALRRRVAACRDESLKLGGADRDREAQLDYLSLVLHRQGLPKGLAARIVVAAAQRGACEPPTRPRILPREVLDRRTTYDLYAALAREAQQLPLAVREAVEQAAYNLLTGKIHLR